MPFSIELMADASDCDAFNRAATPEGETQKEKETALSQEEQEEEEQQQQHSVLDSVQETAIAQEQPLALAEMEQHSAGSELEVKKQRLLEELESALLPKGKPKDSVQDLPLPVAAAIAVGPSKGLGLGLGLGIEVIDETAVVETLSLPDSASGIGIGKGKGKKGSANAAPKKDGNKQSGSRRRGKKDALKQHKIGKKTNTEPPITNGNGNGNGKKRRYSRKDMEALRFVNVDNQRSFWNAIYACLQPHVASEYDTLWAGAVAVAVATTSTNDPGACLPKKKQAPPLLSEYYVHSIYLSIYAIFSCIRVRGLIFLLFLKCINIYHS